MLDSLLGYLTTLLGAAMLLLLAMVAGVITLILALSAADIVVPSWFPSFALYGIGAAPGFLLFRILGSRAEEQYPELRSPGMRAMRLAPILGSIVAILELLISAVRAPWAVAGTSELLWVLVSCCGALAGEIALWRQPPSKPRAAVT
jgi:hypothetical protein